MPITVLAGFLGSGKTTLLNRILEGRHGLRAAVIVNDFGSISIDARLIRRRDTTMIELDNGCVCCSVSADLVSQLTMLLEGPLGPEHVLVETSGVSDPGRLLVSLRDPHLRTLSRVDGVITLVDAAGFDAIPPTVHELARRQLANADLIVFTKCDLVDEGALLELQGRLTYPRARVLFARFGDVPLEVLLGIDGHAVAAPDPDGQVAHDHDALFTTWAWTSTRPLAYEAVRNVLGSLPPEVYRAKGFLYLAESQEQRVVAHVVGRRVDIRPLDGWGGAPRCTELVFVGVSDVVDTAAVTDRLEGTIACGSSGSLVAE